MRAVWQRVEEAWVKVNDHITGQIGKGALIFVGIEKDDSVKDAQYIASKAVNLRLFEDQSGKFSHSLLDIQGELLVVSQFTLHGDCRRGRRPSFSNAAPPDTAKKLYDEVITATRNHGINVKTGIFQADMKVHLINDGPVTLLIDSKKKF